MEPGKAYATVLYINLLRRYLRDGDSEMYSRTLVLAAKESGIDQSRIHEMAVLNRKPVSL